MTDGEGAQWLCLGMRFPFDKIVFDVSAEFIAKHITALFPEGFATRRAEEIHHDLFPSQPQRWRKQSLPPFEKGNLRIGKKRHERSNETGSLVLGKRLIIPQSVGRDPREFRVGGNEMIPICKMLVN